MNAKLTLALVLIVVLSACHTVKMTKKETDNILSAGAEVPFRVLTVNNVADSLVLRTPSKNIDPLADKALLDIFLKRLKQTMEVESGVGIAAAQVGILRNIFLFTRLDKPGHPVQVAINPKILNHSAETFCFERDGCLSVPEKSGNTRRYEWIEVEYMTPEGNLIRERLAGGNRGGDFTGIIFQHEFDHLQGILYTDKLY